MDILKYEHPGIKSIKILKIKQKVSGSSNASRNEINVKLQQN